MYYQENKKQEKIAELIKQSFTLRTEEEFKETIKKAQIGVKYFKDRKKITREYKRRLEKITASKEPKTFREPKKKRDKNLKFQNVK